MENSAYVPSSPLPPPAALVVFSQAGGGSLSDALRMQRPFNHQLPDSAKDLHLPFSGAGGFGYPHLLHHLQPQHFLHPALDPRITFGSQGAFRPLSAFAPPGLAAKLKEEAAVACSSRLFSPASELLRESSPELSASPPEHRTGLAPGDPCRDESMSATEDNRADTPGSERSTPEEGRGFRRRKQHRAEPACCPVCGVTLRSGELEAHFLHEVERLYKLSASSPRTPTPRPPRPPSLPASGPRSRHGQGDVASVSAGDSSSTEGRWDTYQRVRSNRQGRLRSKHRGGRGRRGDEVTCPVCGERIQHGNATVEELNAHVERCLMRKQAAAAGSNGGPDPDCDEPVDVEGDVGDEEMYEEYEWAGQRRVRASSMLMGGYAGAGLASSQPRGHEDEDEGDLLVVDGDDTATYGPAQYSEADIIVTPAEGGAREQRERQALRDALISPDMAARAVKQEPESEASDSAGGEGAGSGEPEDLSATPGVQTPGSSGNPLVEALKSRIRELEAAAAADKYKCLICMERFRKPVISICCWHVHCEECWLHTLGAKKLCPQCNMITSPSDLRRIFL